MANQKPHLTLRPLLSGAAATAGLALTTAAHAQSPAAANGNREEAQNDATVLKKITVAGAGQGTTNTNEASTGISRLPATIRETPKVVNVVPKEIIEQQRATTLKDILKNVPGITLSTGEGNGGQNGDQFRIRGLTSKGDMYIDGLRDFGTYRRDSFNTESVQVIKGPSGDGFGVGNLGGVINQSTKKARLGTSTDIDQSIGSGLTARTTVDSNIQINDTTAVRLNGMFEKQDVPDRDGVKADRRGFAADLGLGLGTDTEWHLNYSYLHNDGVPDYGVSMVQGADGVYRPMLEYGIPGIGRSQSYVRSVDRDVTNAHILTSNLVKELENGVTITNDTRLSIYDRDFSSTNPGPLTYANLRDLLNGRNVVMSYGAGGGVAYLQDGWAIQNVTTAKGEFETGGLRHRALIGLDVNHQDDSREQGVWTGRPSDQTVVNPRFDYPLATVAYGATTRDANASDIGIFANDRVWFTDQFSIQAGLRWDYFRSEYETNASAIGGTADSRKLSPAISAIWEPAPDYTLYASYARTYRPVGTDIASAVGGVATEVPSNRDNQPERADVYEIGAKADFLDGRLGVTAAAFHIDKSNSFTIDPATGDIAVGFSDNGEGRKINGVEIGVTGKLTENWTAYLAYAYLDGEVSYSSTAANIGNDAPGVSRNNITVWTAYELPEVGSLPGKVTVGGGFQYASAYFADSANTARVPANFSLDAVLGYKQDNFRVSLNAYNLTDHQNYESSFASSRAVPSSGRTFMVNIGTTF